MTRPRRADREPTLSWPPAPNPRPPPWFSRHQQPRAGPLVVGATAAGAAVGTMTSFWDLAILAAGPAGGLVAESIGFRAAFWTAAAIVLVSLALTSTLPQRRSARRADTKEADHRDRSGALS
jgi:MFS family permease